MKKIIFFLTLVILSLSKDLRAQQLPPYDRTRQNQVMDDRATWSRSYLGIPTGTVPFFPSYVPDSLKCKAYFNVTSGVMTPGLYRYNCSSSAWEIVGNVSGGSGGGLVIRVAFTTTSGSPALIISNYNTVYKPLLGNKPLLAVYDNATQYIQDVQTPAQITYTSNDTTQNITSIKWDFPIATTGYVLLSSGTGGGGSSGVSTFNTRTGTVVLNLGDVTGALGFMPYNASNPAGYINTIVGIGAGGDLTGVYPYPTINTINGITKSFYDPVSSIQGQFNSKINLNGGGQTVSSPLTLTGYFIAGNQGQFGFAPNSVNFIAGLNGSGVPIAAQSFNYHGTGVTFSNAGNALTSPDNNDDFLIGGVQNINIYNGGGTQAAVYAQFNSANKSLILNSGGSFAADPLAVLQIDAVLRVVKLHGGMSSTQRDALSGVNERDIIYNNTFHTYQFWNGSSWVNL